MDKESNLSDKIWAYSNGSSIINTCDVKEFIRAVKEEIISTPFYNIFEIIDKHAGKALIDSLENNCAPKEKKDGK